MLKVRQRKKSSSPKRHYAHLRRRMLHGRGLPIFKNGILESGRFAFTHRVITRAPAPCFRSITPVNMYSGCWSDWEMCRFLQRLSSYRLARRGRGVTPLHLTEHCWYSDKESFRLFFSLHYSRSAYDFFYIWIYFLYCFDDQIVLILYWLSGTFFFTYFHFLTAIIRFYSAIH